jgi:hypothetical protein
MDQLSGKSFVSNYSIQTPPIYTVVSFNNGTFTSSGYTDIVAMTPYNNSLALNAYNPGSGTYSLSSGKYTLTSSSPSPGAVVTLTLSSDGTSFTIYRNGSPLLLPDNSTLNVFTLIGGSTNFTGFFNNFLGFIALGETLSIIANIMCIFISCLCSAILAAALLRQK